MHNNHSHFLAPPFLLPNPPHSIALAPQILSISLVAPRLGWFPDPFCVINSWVIFSLWAGVSSLCTYQAGCLWYPYYLVSLPSTTISSLAAVFFDTYVSFGLSGVSGTGVSFGVVGAAGAFVEVLSDLGLGAFPLFLYPFYSCRNSPLMVNPPLVNLFDNQCQRLLYTSSYQRSACWWVLGTVSQNNENGEKVAKFWNNCSRQLQP